jgi:hypothetical protein
MTVFVRRSRTVNFRLSEMEFEHLRAACMSDGARSVSEYARAVLLRSLGSQPESLSLRDSIRRIDGRLERMQSELGELLAVITGRNPRPLEITEGKSAAG